MAKILIVEDESTIAEAVAYNLKRQGHSTAIAADGLAALEAFSREQPDLVLLDLMLPRMDGISVCRKLRQASNVPVLMLTARDEEIDKVVGLEVGADDYITKPFSMRELVARVQATLRRVEMDTSSQATGASALSVDDLVIDPARHEVRRAGSLVELAPKEFDLLLFLASHQGRVFSRDAILERVWGYSYGGETRTVDVHIRGLREKLEDDVTSPRYIETVRRVGYRFRQDAGHA
ncbi:MAG: response regulator transcription factor [Chloroflexi bacterium]|nr:response regulator transcription factor [Chloroflexota bacterium]